MNMSATVTESANLPQRQAQHHAVTFTGNGREYFGIWIVNVLLSIVTLGIYSAWAKVRRMQYFARNTQIDGASFDYHGDPKAILKGRLIAFALFAIYQFAGIAHPFLGVGVAIVLAGVMPALLLRSLRFRLYNLSYRGLRFHFSGSMKEAYLVLLAWPLAIVFSVGLLLPMFQQRLKRFQHRNSAFGQTPFSFNASVKSFYWVYLQALGLALVALVLIGGIAFAVAFSSSLLGGGSELLQKQHVVLFASLLPITFIVLIWIVLQPFMAARMQNLIWRHTALSDHRFDSRVSAGTLFGIHLSNLFFMIITLGFYRPFAVARLYRYQAEAITLLASGTLDEFIAANSQGPGATGDEMAEMFDIDIAL